MSGGGSRVPTAILTGFLGSGKTTVLNRLVRHPDMARALVVINELGDIGLDHDLVQTVTGDVVLLRSGCLCCTVRSDLIVTLQDVLAKARAKEIPAFDRVVIETTGLADPQPVMQAFLADPDVATRFELRSILATVDAVLGEATLDRHVEAVKQAAVADVLLVTKTDMTSATDGLRRRLRALNKTAAIDEISLATPLDPARLWQVQSAVPSEASAEPCAQHGVAQCMDDGCAHDHAYAAPSVAAHSDGVRTFSFVRVEPIPAALLDRWLVSFLDARGPDLLRFKAIVNVAELTGPLVLHGVQHVIHPPMQMKAWPSADRRTRMVFITLGLDEQVLRNAVALLEATTASA